MASNEYGWTAGNGKAIMVTALGYDTYRVTADGQEIVRSAYIITPKGGRDLEMLRKAGVVAYLPGDVRGVMIGLTAERKTALVALDAPVTAEREAAWETKNADKLTAARLADAVERAEARLARDGYGDTGANGAAVDAAKAALHAWVEAHPDAWTRYLAERKAAATPWWR